MKLPPAAESFLNTLLLFLSEDPQIRMFQFSVGVVGILLVFIIFLVTKDILQRTNSFFLMLISIVLVTFLPFVGALLYLLIRPSRTLAEKQVQADIKFILKALGNEPEKIYFGNAGKKKKTPVKIKK